MSREVKVAVMDSVVERMEPYPAELWCVDGRMFIRAYNEGGNNYTELPMLELIKWLKEGNPDTNE